MYMINHLRVDVSWNNKVFLIKDNCFSIKQPLLWFEELKVDDLDIFVMKSSLINCDVEIWYSNIILSMEINISWYAIFRSSLL